MTNTTNQRQASETILKLRSTFAENMGTIKNVTSKELSERFGATRVEINNTLAFFEKSGMVSRVGMKDREAGARGRKEVIWSAAESV